MAIVSRSLTKLANREDIGPGIKRWRVNGVDTIGRRWVYGPFPATFAEAEVIRDAQVWNGAEADKADLLEWVKDRNTVASFDYTGRDIVEADGEEHIFKWFAESPGNDAITVSWWMDDINTGTFNTIRDRVGYSSLQGSDITSRFTFMASVEPWFELTIEAP